MISNIDKALRRKQSAYATMLVGYLPVSKGEVFTDATHSEVLYMRDLLEPLISAGQKGVLMACADQKIHCVFPNSGCVRGRSLRTMSSRLLPRNSLSEMPRAASGTRNSADKPYMQSRCYQGSP